MCMYRFLVGPKSSLMPLLCLVVLILYVPSTIFQLNRDRSSWVEPVLSWDKCVLLKDHNAVTPVRLKPEASRSRVKHSTTEPLRSLPLFCVCCQFLGGCSVVVDYMFIVALIVVGVFSLVFVLLCST